MTLYDYVDQQSLILTIIRHPDDEDKWHVSIYASRISTPVGPAIVMFGYGKTLDEAIHDYALLISGKTLFVFDQTYHVPQLT